MFVRTCIGIYVFVHVCMYVFIYVFMYVCMHVCMYLCMYVCMLLFMSMICEGNDIVFNFFKIAMDTPNFKSVTSFIRYSVM